MTLKRGEVKLILFEGFDLCRFHLRHLHRVTNIAVEDFVAHGGIERGA